MRALGIVGSYTVGGVIDTAVGEALAGAEDAGFAVEKVFLADKDIRYCRNCRSCAQDEGATPGHCVIDDDMAGIIEACRAADVLVLGAPVNMGAATAVTKAFQERLLPLAYWPWSKSIPVARVLRRAPRPRAVLVASSVSPAFLARRVFGAMGTLRAIAGTFDARVTDELWLGLVGRTPGHSLPEAHRARARRAGVHAAWRRGLDPERLLDEARRHLPRPWP
jgi:NAD(P)H-dependent FMN reductase